MHAESRYTNFFIDSLGLFNDVASISVYTA
jgi:hypothetical protein